MKDLHTQRKVAVAVVAVVLSALLGVACEGASPAVSNSELGSSATMQVTPAASATSTGDYVTQQVSPTPEIPTPAQETPKASPSSQPEPASAPGSAQVPSSSPVLCNMDGPEVYLVFKAARYHIADWDTFLNLGYKQEQITACGSTSKYAEGVPITRLLKGSSDPVYWMENGLRRHIPDMETFGSLGYQVTDISVLPDEVVALWPLGQPLASVSSGESPYQQTVIGTYTIRLFHPIPGQGMFDWAIISSHGQPDVRVESVQALGVLPASDVTGEGDPDVMFETREGGGGHCCWGTVVYNLGSIPTKILDVRSTAYYPTDTGTGDFQNLDGVGAYEFVTYDPLSGIPCTSPVVKVILQYAPGRGYVGVSPRFPDVYAQDILSDTQLAETWIEESKTGYKCGVAGLIFDYLYSGQVSRAHEELLRLYLGADVEEFWQQLQQSASQGRFYVPPAG